MASSLNAATSGGGGVIVTSDASGNLNLQSGGTTVAAVTSAGVAVTGTLSATGNIRQMTNNTGYFQFTNTSGNGAHFASMNAVERIIIDASSYGVTFSGAVAVGTGLAVTGLVDISAATSGQIKFPATQNASANANTLDDYEEGTFTVTDQSGAGLTFSNNTGRYVKVGGLVYFAMDVIFPTTASVTNIALSLPFQSGTSCAFSAAVGYSNSGSIPSAYIGISQSSVSLYSTTGVAVTNVTFSGKELAISGCYPTT
jgi:hypothetical protein